MLNSFEIYTVLKNLGYTLEPNKYEPSYASEHALGDGRYLYVKRKADRIVNKSPLVLHPDTLALCDKIDAIGGVFCTWEKSKSTSYRRFPRDGDSSQYGFDADIASVEALHMLLELLTGTTPNPISSPVTLRKEPLAMFPLNQILFGPPGTGKTYSTTELAVKIADGEWYQQVSQTHYGQSLRDEVKARYQMLIEKQQIMFTTFHQSFSYEDFIEGIRATTDESTGALRYDVVDGIFKQLCQNAEVKVQGDASQSVSLIGRRIWKMSLGNTLGGEEYIYDECLGNNYILLGWGDNIDFTGCATLDEVKERIVNKGSSADQSEYMSVAVNTFKNVIRPGDLIVVSDGNHKFRAIAQVTGDYQYFPEGERVGFHQMRSVKWLRKYEPSLPKEHLFHKTLSQMTLYELKDTTIDREKLAQLLAPGNEKEQSALPHVLIIDEINRGNISRIFGELITLLEPDKRQGAEDARTLTLPYSKQKFTVPKNVFLIGTMNTADKSLIQMDLALRRRFSFVEMLPQPALLAGVTAFGVDLSLLIQRINQRIEALIDAEHTIGHAYFIPLKAIESQGEREAQLGVIFKEKIIPLLKEYFFDDYERIGWVLNDPVKAESDRFISQQTSEHLPALTTLFPAEIAEGLTDRRYRINAQAFTLAAAYQGIVQ